MAIAFAQVSIHTRSKDHSAIAAAAYRSGAKLYDERIGRHHDYSYRNDVQYSEILLPANAHDSFRDRNHLWNVVEQVENRCNSQLCKDFVLALPRELDLAQQIELAKRFANVHFIAYGLPADISIHDHSKGNPHAHILVPTRRLEGRQFSKHKARDLNPAFAKGVVVENDYWGEQWRELQNEYFIEKNLDLQVDLNHLISERHLGKHKDKSTHYLLEENLRIQQARMEMTRKNIEKVITHLSTKYSVFTRSDIERLLFKTFQPSNNHQEYLQFVAKILGHKEVIALGKNSRGHESFTTRNHFLQEAELLENIEEMMTSNRHATNHSLERFSRKYNLSDEQRAAFNYIIHGPNISVVIGRPGTGKSYLLKPVKEYYTQEGAEVVGAALSGKVAKTLEAETGIPSFTIKSLSYQLANHLLQLSAKHVLIIDEAGMVDFASMSYLINAVKKAGAKLVLIGDPDQLKPIQKGEIFRGITACTGYIELENIKRQQDVGDRQASLDLANGHIDKAIKHYLDKNAITFASTTLAACEQLINDWNNDLKTTNIADTLMLSFTRKAVNYLNEQAREALITDNKIGNENIPYRGLERTLNISTGERLLFRENNKLLGVRNGDIATVTAVSSQQMSVKLDSGELLTIPKEYQALDYAYALTVHKSQGMTAKKVKVLIDSKYWDRSLSYVAMTRHKESLRLYVDKENHPTEQTLKQTLLRKTTKDNVIDWPFDFANRAGFNNDSLITKVIRHIVGVGHKIMHSYNFIVNYEKELLKAKQTEKFPNSQYDRVNAIQKAKQIDGKENSSIEHQLNIKALTSLKNDFPHFSDFVVLIENRKLMTGYLAERADKKIDELSIKLLTNKMFVAQVKNKLPQLLEKIEFICQKQHVRFSAQDLNK